MKRNLPAPFVPNLAGRVDPITDKVIQDLHFRIGELQRQVTSIKRTPATPQIDLETVSRELSIGGSNPINVQGLIGQSSAVTKKSITVGASAFTYKNGTGKTTLVTISSGTVSLVEIAPDGANFVIVGGGTNTVVTIPPNGGVRVTYTVAPVMSHWE